MVGDEERLPRAAPSRGAEARGFPERIGALLNMARERARATGRPVVASLSEPAPAVDPLAMLAAFAGDETLTERMYWARPSRGLAIAGMGGGVTLSAGAGRRFEMADEARLALLANAVVDDPSGGAPGVGPTLLGGFSFDPDGPRTERWKGFPAALFFLPWLQLAATEGGHWLTMTVLVDPAGTPDIDVASLGTLRGRALAAGAAADRAGPDADSGPHGRPRGRTGRTTEDGRQGGQVDYVQMMSPDAWRQLVEEGVRAIRAGSLEKVVVAREVRALATAPFDVQAALRHLRAAYPDCYVFCIWRDGAAFLGASPERLARFEGGLVKVSTLAGSIRRGATSEEDAALGESLLASAKDRAEHEVVRRTLFETLAELCDDVTAEEGPTLLSLAQVHHLHTAVAARLRDGHTPLELVARMHPTPAVGGSPRDAALRFLRQHEELDRGWYAAPIGWLQRNAGEFAVALRSALVRGDEASLFAGCGVVADSDPDREYAESVLKLVPMERALAAAAAPGPSALMADGPSTRAQP